MATALMGIGKRNKSLNAADLEVVVKIGPIDFDPDRPCGPFDVTKHLTSDYPKRSWVFRYQGADVVGPGRSSTSGVSGFR